MQINSDSILVRDMTLTDVEDVFRIENQSFSSPWDKESFIQEVQNNHLARYWVILLDDLLIGYGGCWFIIDEAHITNIAIDKKYRGLGMGKKLVQCMIEDMKKQDIASTTLEVRKSNEVALNMYRSMGFSMEGVRKNYYEKPREDALILWKKFVENI